MPTILVVDDVPGIRSSLAGALGREGFQVEVASSPDEARPMLREAYDFVLLDVSFPSGNGLDLLAEIAAAAPETVVIMMSGQASIEAAVRATRLGAYDFLEKPIGLDRLLVLLRNAGEARALQSENRRLRKSRISGIIGRSPALRALITDIERIGPTSARVLIQGEHGTGKELVARGLHQASPRRDRPFIAVNCSAIPEELIESELFGHERGSFTGATQARRGRFEEADGGTLFLDEVADLSPRAQTKLLRVLQEGELTRVGGSRGVRVDVRVVSATNRDLSAAAQTGAFREDLYFRLAVIPLTVPPLRDRREDVPLLVEHFLAQVARDVPSAARAFAPEAMAVFAGYRFPGNVRELRNLVERLAIMSRGPAISAAEVRAVLPSAAEPATEESGRLADTMRRFEREQIERALEAAGGNVTRAAEKLGIERSHLYKKLRKLGLQTDA